MSATFVDPGSTVGDIGTMLPPSTDVRSRVRSFAFVVSPQLTMVAAVLTRSKGMTLLGRIGVPALGPLVGVEPALSPEAVGCARTTFASMSLAGLWAGCGSTAMFWNRKSDAASSTGTAITGVICGTAAEAAVIGGRKRCE